jgi:hypothetical protein
MICDSLKIGAVPGDRFTATKGNPVVRITATILPLINPE